MWDTEATFTGNISQKLIFLNAKLGKTHLIRPALRE